MINPQNANDFAQLFDYLARAQPAVANICFAWPSTVDDLHDDTCVKEALNRGVYSFLFVCQSLVTHKLESHVQLLYVYGVQPGGAQPPTASWGLMVSTGRDVLLVAPHVATVPGVAIMAAVLAFNLVGDGLRDALDPRLRGSA